MGATNVMFMNTVTGVNRYFRSYSTKYLNKTLETKNAWNLIVNRKPCIYRENNNVGRCKGQLLSILREGGRIEVLPTQTLFCLIKDSLMFEDTLSICSGVRELHRSRHVQRNYNPLCVKLPPMLVYNYIDNIYFDNNLLSTWQSLNMCGRS